MLQRSKLTDIVKAHPLGISIKKLFKPKPQSTMKISVSHDVDSSDHSNQQPVTSIKCQFGHFRFFFVFENDGIATPDIQEKLWWNNS